VEGVRQLVDHEHVRERLQAVGASSVDLIEFLGCCRRSRAGHVLKPGSEGITLSAVNRGTSAETMKSARAAAGTTCAR
jgi:hypothetical protein